MPSIELKSIDRLKSGDRLLLGAGVFAKAGREVDERAIKLLARHKVAYAATIGLSYEEEKAGSNLDSMVDEFLMTRYTGAGGNIRGRLLEKLKSIYIPFSEADRIFQVKGKKKQLTSDKMLEIDPGALYLPDITAGSQALFDQQTMRYLHESIAGLYKYYSGKDVHAPETRNKRNRLAKISFSSIRLHTHYDGERMGVIGDTFAHQAVETALAFLITMININKKRIIEGAPLAEQRFDPDKNLQRDSRFQYREDPIIEAALGILLHNIGFFHESVHKIVSSRYAYDPESKACKNRIRTVQRSVYVSRNLLRERHDLSSIIRMMVGMQHEYPDGTGFPKLNRNSFVHEFVRLFQIIRTYDEMTNPSIASTPYSRWEAIKHLLDNSGSYEYSTEGFITCPRFDRGLLNEFLSMLAPYEPGEKVYLFGPKNNSSPHYIGRVFSYGDSWCPLISILRDERNSRNYPYGKLVFHLPSGKAFMMKQGKVEKTMKVDQLKQLRILDRQINPASIKEFEDPLFSQERVLARQVKQLR